MTIPLPVLIALAVAAAIVALVVWDPAILRPYRLALVTGLALVAALIGRMLTGRDEPRGLVEPTDPQPPPPYTPPSTTLEELDDEAEDEQGDTTAAAVADAAELHDADPDVVADLVAGANAHRER